MDASPMMLCRFQPHGGEPRVGLVIEEDQVRDLSAAGGVQFSRLLELEGLTTRLTELAKRDLPVFKLTEVKLLPPVERQEVWAAGVTYLRSKRARMEESDFSATAYDRVYDAPRPELFFKAMPEKVVGPGDAVGIRRDSRWNVPEPELALVINSRGQVAGCTIGNDVSSRDLEGENLLYLPQAKIYERSCALGPCVRVGVHEAEVRSWTISLQVLRQGEGVFRGETAVANLKRTFAELVEYLFASQRFPNGVVLLTGTGVVPHDDFTLQPGDTIRIEISGLGVLENSVIEV